MRSFLLTLSMTGLMVFVPFLGAQSTDVKQSPELAKIDALAKQISELAAAIKGAEWEIRIKKLESEVLNLKDSIVRMESLAKADETRRSFYTPPTPPTIAAKPVVPATVGTLRLINSTGFVGTVTINGKDYTVLPSQTVLIPGMPTGEFRYEARADGFGILQPTVTRTLSTAEMFTITLYPR